MDKSTLRTQIKLKKKSMTKEEIMLNSGMVYVKLTRLKEFLESKNVYIYVSYNEEVSTLEIIRHCLDLGKCVYVPKIIEKDMYFIRIHSIDELKPGTYGILEPVGDEKDTEYNGIMITPMLACDKNFNRLGYGAGFYDRYFEKHKDHLLIGLAHDFQVVSEVPVDEHDIPLDMIITPQKIYKKSIGE